MQSDYIRLNFHRVKHNKLCFGSFFSDPTNPSYLKLQGFPYFFFDGDANDPSVQAAIKTNYIDFMTKSYMVPPFFCLFKQPECNENTVEVYAGSCE